MSAKALSDIIAEINRTGLPELIGRPQLREARDHTVNHITYYGKLLQNVVLPGIDDSIAQDIRTLVVSHPLAMLHHCLETIEPFWAFFKARLVLHPCTAATPWHLVLYTDEVVPGSVLAPLTLRKSQAIYWTFSEFGAEALCREDVWLCIGAKRSETVGNIQGGMAKVVGELLKLFFSSDSTSLHPEDGGVTFTGCNGESFRFFAVFDQFIQDGGAHKTIWCLRGDGGTKFCVLCKNATDLGVIVETDLDFATDDEVRGTVARLNTYKTTDNVTTFKLREQALGFTWSPYSLLADPDLTRVVAPCSQFCHDWMHCIVASGLFQLVLQLLLDCIETDGVRNAYVLCKEFLSMCHWPVGSHNSKLSLLFEDTRRTNNRKAGVFKCQASDALSMYPLLAYFVLTQFRKATVAVHACDAFLSLCDVIDLFTSAARRVVTPRMMRGRVNIFLQAFVAAFGAESLIPKCHWLLHFAKHLERWGMLLSCFVTERKHKMLKRYANQVENTIRFEHSVMSEVVCHQLAKLSDPDLYNFDIGLINPQLAPRALAEMLMAEFVGACPADIKTASTSRISRFAVCGKKDVVLYTNNTSFCAAGEVWAHVCVLGVNMTIVTEWVCLERDEPTMTAVWQARQEPIYIATEDILAPCAWVVLRDDVVRTFLPTHITIG